MLRDSISKALAAEHDASRRQASLHLFKTWKGPEMVSVVLKESLRDLRKAFLPKLSQVWEDGGPFELQIILLRQGFKWSTPATPSCSNKAWTSKELSIF